MDQSVNNNEKNQGEDQSTEKVIEGDGSNQKLPDITSQDELKTSSDIKNQCLTEKDNLSFKFISLSNNKADTACTSEQAVSNPKSSRPSQVKLDGYSESTSNVRISFRASGKPTALLRLYGSIDSKTIKLLRFACDVCISKNTRSIIVDMGNITDIGSTGWGYFVAESNRLKTLGGTLMLTAMKPDTYNFFTMLGIDKNVKAEQKVEDCQRVIDDSTSISNNIYETKALYIQDQNSSIIKIDELNSVSQSSSPKETPLFEKLFSMIARYGPCSFFEIKNRLNSDEFGNVSIGVIELYGILKEINLESNKKRLRFYRSC